MADSDKKHRRNKNVRFGAQARQSGLKGAKTTRQQNRGEKI
jgi:hypothetical protein